MAIVYITSVIYTYFNVSARKKLCCTSSCVGVREYTSFTPENPPLTRQYFSIACEGKQRRHFNCKAVKRLPSKVHRKDEHNGL